MKLLRSLTNRAKGQALDPIDRGGATGQTTSNPPKSLSYSVDQYTYFQGILWLSGWAFASDDHILNITWKFKDCSVPIRSFGATSPDVAAVYGQSAATCRFAEVIDLKLPIEQVLQGQLHITYSSGATAAIGKLGVPTADPAHALYTHFLQEIRGKSKGALLEVGSRARSGITRRSDVPSGWSYSGLDVMAGPNVDVVGDAHEISSLYPKCAFDAVMAFSVLEHILMPWKFVVELNKVLKIGAIGIFTTHQTWPLHDEPWDFWRFSDTAWMSLFNTETGYEILEAKMGEPAYVTAYNCHPATGFVDLPAARLASFVLFRKIRSSSLSWPVKLRDVIGTSYPPGEIGGTPP